MYLHPCPTRPAVARVLFDEAHGEAWTIRPEVAGEISPRTRRTPPTSSRRGALRGALRGDRRRTSRAARRARARRGRRARARASLRPALGAHGRRRLAAAARRRARGDRGVRARRRRPDRARRGGAGQVRQQPQRAARALRHPIASDAISDYEHNDGAPHWVLAELGPGARDGVDLLARVHSACFYRAGRLELRNGAGVLARSSPTASTPGAPLLAVDRAGAGRVVVAADSDLFGDDCFASRDHEDLWCNLVLWAAGGAFRRPALRPRVAGRRRPALAGAARRRRSIRPARSRRLGRPRRARPRARWSAEVEEAIAAVERLRRTSRTSTSTSPPSSTTSRRGRPAASSGRTSPPR